MPNTRIQQLLFNLNNKLKLSKSFAESSETPPRLSDAKSLTVDDRHAELLAIWQEIGEDKERKLQDLRSHLSMALDRVYDQAMEESVRKRIALKVSVSENEKKIKNVMGNKAKQALAPWELPLKTRLNKNLTQLQHADSKRVGGYGWAGGLLVISELRDRVIVLREALGLPSCDDVSDLDELLSSTMEGLHKLSPNKVPSTLLQETPDGDGKPIFQRLQRFYKTLQAMEDTFADTFSQKTNAPHELEKETPKPSSKPTTQRKSPIRNARIQRHKRKSSEDVNLEQLSQKIINKLEELSENVKQSAETKRNSQSENRDTSDDSEASLSSFERSDSFKKCDSPLTPTSVLPERTQTSMKPGIFINPFMPPLLWLPRNVVIDTPNPNVEPPFPANKENQNLSPLNFNTNILKKEERRIITSSSLSDSNDKVGDVKASMTKAAVTSNAQPLQTVINAIQDSDDSVTSLEKPKSLANPPLLIPSQSLPLSSVVNKEVDSSLKEGVLSEKVSSSIAQPSVLIPSQSSSPSSLVTKEVDSSLKEEVLPEKVSSSLALKAKSDTPGIEEVQVSPIIKSTIILPQSTLLKKFPPPPPPPAPGVHFPATGGKIPPPPLPAPGVHFPATGMPGGKVPPPPPPAPGVHSSATGMPGGKVPPPPPPGGVSLLSKKPNSKLKRSPQIGNLYRGLKRKVEGGVQTSRTSPSRRKMGGDSGSGKGGMAQALEEITRRSAYFQKIKEEVVRYDKEIKEAKSAIESFQTKNMNDLIKFHKEVEVLLEKLTDESKVLSKFEEFPTQKLEVIRSAAALFSKLNAMINDIKTWKIEGAFASQLDKIILYFDKSKQEIENLERIKDKESKAFKSHNIHFDFDIVIRIKEAMVDLSSNCISLALQESKATKATLKASKSSGSKGAKERVKEDRTMMRCFKLLWKTFDFSYRVYSFAGGLDERTEELMVSLGKEMESYPSFCFPS